MIAKRIALFALALLWPIISIVTLSRYLWLAVFNPTGAINVAIGVDQLLNTQLDGEPDEMLSARAHRMRVKGQRYWGWVADAIDRVFFWDREHCLTAWRYEVERRQLPPEMREMPK